MPGRSDLLHRSLFRRGDNRSVLVGHAARNRAPRAARSRTQGVSHAALPGSAGVGCGRVSLHARGTLAGERSGGGCSQRRAQPLSVSRSRTIPRGGKGEPSRVAGPTVPSARDAAGWRWAHAPPASGSLTVGHRGSPAGQPTLDRRKAARRRLDLAPARAVLARNGQIPRLAPRTRDSPGGALALVVPRPRSVPGEGRGRPLRGRKADGRTACRLGWPRACAGPRGAPGRPLCSQTDRDFRRPDVRLP